MSKQKYKIAITGIGTAKELMNALRQVAQQIKNVEGTEDEFELLDGIEWEDSTLITQVNAETEVIILSDDGKGQFVIPETNRDALVDMGLVSEDGRYKADEWEKVSEAIKDLK